MEGDFRLGPWLVCPKLNAVRAASQTIRVEPKFMQVLVCLAARPGDVISKEDLMRTVWADTFVTDDVLTRAISELRHIFKDDPKHPQFIETVAKNGYRLIAPVQSAIPERSSRRIGRLAFVAAGSLLLLAVVLAFLFRRQLSGARTSSARFQSIAVLPLDDLSHDPAQEYFADGLTDQLINDLAQVQALRVVSRTSVMQFKGSRKSLPDVVKTLNVDAVLEGAVLRSGGRVRITAQLIDARQDKQLWAHTYEGEIGDVLKLQSVMADAITREIQVAVTAQEQLRIRTARRVDPDALDAYLRAQYYWNLFSEEGMTKAVEYFQKAIDKDPDWAPAYAGQAHAYHELSWYQRPNEVMPKARMAAEKALQLDPTDAEAHAALAWVKWVYEWDWPGSEAEFKRAIELRPNSALAHGQFALFLASAGRSSEALEHERTALQLDPLSLINNTNLADILADDGQLDLAIQQYLSTIAKDPHFGPAHANLGITYALRGRFSDAIKEIRVGQEYDPDPQYLGLLAWIYARDGRKQQARETLQALDKLSRRQYMPASISAGVLALLGNRDQAFAALQKGVKERDSNLAFLRDPSLVLLRSDPRIERLLHAVGPPPKF
jgi:TolB-like protein/DNA-binding winged helix-turn-helix (wHTH) protein/Flp pilus assembly protein TadD